MILSNGFNENTLVEKTTVASSSSSSSYLNIRNEYSMTGLTTPGSTLSEKPLHKNQIDAKLNSINILKNIIDRMSKIKENSKINANKANSNINANKDDISYTVESSDTFESLFAIAKKSVSLSYKDYIFFQQQRQQQQHQHQSTHYYNNFYSTLSTHLNTIYKNTTSLSNYSESFLNSSTELFRNSMNLSKDLLNINNNNNNYTYSQLKMGNFSNDFFKMVPTSMDTFKKSLTLNNDLSNLTNTIKTNSPLLVGIGFFYSVLIITSLTSNPLLIYVLLWRRKAQIKLIDIFVANLSLSDLFLTLFNIPLALIIYFRDQWPFGSLVCQIGTYSTSCSIYVNIFTMAYISIDRYFAVTKPFISSNQNYQLRKKSILTDDRMRKKIYLVLTLIWIIAMVLSVPQFLFSKVSSTKITNEKDYLTNLKHIHENKIIKNKIDTELKELEMMSNVESNQFAVENKKLLNNKTNREGYDLDLENDLMLINEANSMRDFDLSEDPFKRCILEYPIENMKTVMILVNFSLQYLIPSIVILYFYGKIIYHLYLNLNVEELMESPQVSEISKKKQHKISRNRSSSEITKIDIKKTSIDCLSSSNTALQEQNHPVQRKHSRMRIDGLNRTRNLKKSIKVMIIIIALFLLSWLPIHLYRLITTFYPIILRFFENASSASDTNFNFLEKFHQNQSILNINKSKDFLLNALKSGNIGTEYKFKTLHNRYAFMFLYFIAMSSVCYNPIVYFWMHKKFRTEVKQLFSRMFNCSKSSGRRNSLIVRRNAKKDFSAHTNAETACTLLPTLAHCIQPNVSNNSNEIIENFKKANANSSKNIKKKQVSYVNSFKIRSKRFSSLSSESTVSSTKKSDHF